MERRAFIFSLNLKTFIVLLVFLGSISCLPEDQTRIHSETRSWQRAQWLREQGKFEESLKIFEEYARGKHYKGQLSEHVIWWQNIALNYWNLGEVDRALNSFMFIMQALQDYADDSVKEYARVAIDIINLYGKAKLSRQDKNYQQSEKLFLEAIQLAQKHNMKELELKSLRQVGLLYWNQNKVEESFKIADRALRIAREINHRLEECYALNQVGNYYFKKKNYKRAHELFDEAVFLAEKEGKLDYVPESLDNLGITYYLFGNYELSEYFFKKALNIYQKNNDTRNIVMDLMQLAIFIYKKIKTTEISDNVDESFRLMHKALELSQREQWPELEVRILNNMGYIYLENDLKKAEEFTLQAWHRGKLQNDKEVIASSLNNLATIYLRQDQINKALATFKKALSVALKIDYWNEVWRDYSGIAQCYEKLGKFDLSLQYYQKALKAIEKIRETIPLDLHKVSFDREKREIYEGIIRALVSLNEINSRQEKYKELIFDFSNRIKARAFLEGLIQVSEDQPEELNGQLSQIDQEITELLNKPENIHQEEASKKLLELENRYFRILGEGNGQNPQGKQEAKNQLQLELVHKELLDEGQILLDYYLGQEESYCFLISRDTYRVFRLPGEKYIENSIKLYIKLVAMPSTEEADLFSAGYKIASLLIPGIESFSEKINSLVIIPDGLLNYLPFESLVFQDSHDQNRKKYLIEKFKIFYVPSIASYYKLKKLPEQNGYQKELLAFGNPYIESKAQSRVRSLGYFLTGETARVKLSLGVLPYTQQEVKEIARLFPKSSYDLFLKKKATEERLKSLNLRDYRILHFACHGLVSESFPQRSCLVFSLKAGTREDGFLTVREIYNLRVKAEMVVLSACETSRGAVEKIEGIIGLPRVFLLSGSRSVVSSLWSVNDRATRELMKNFYHHLLSGDSKDEALRKAKIEMISAGKSHPYFWAGFILIGNPRKVY